MGRQADIEAEAERVQAEVIALANAIIQATMKLAGPKTTTLSIVLALGMVLGIMNNRQVRAMADSGMEGAAYADFDQISPILRAGMEMGREDIQAVLKN